MKSSAISSKFTVVRMKPVAVVTLFFAVIMVNAEERYTTKYDNINFRDILNNRRLLRGYTNCLLDKGPCSPDGRELKSALPEALKTDCGKCSDKQKEGSRMILRHLVDHEPGLWEEFEKKYDPNRVYRNKYRQQARNDGINL